MNVAICQLNFVVGGIEANKQIIVEQIESHKNKGVDLVVFPEMSLSGAPLYDLVNTPDFTERCYSALSDIADAAKDIAVLVGMPSNEADDIFNSVAFIRDGKVEEIFSKAIPSSRDELAYVSGIDSPFFNEDDVEGDDIPQNVITIDRNRILVTIGEDISFIELENNSFDLIVQIGARSYSHGVIEEDLDFLSSIAKQISKPLITCNAVGAATDIVYYGASAMFNSNGDRVLKMANFEEATAIISTLPKAISSMKTIRISPSNNSSKVRHDYKAISLALKDFFVKQGFTSACLGLSGGIDSAVVVAIAADVLGADNVRVLMMPSQFSSDHSVSDSEVLASKLGIQCEKVAIEPIYNSIIESLSSVVGDAPFSLAEENLQARIRGVLMMFLSNKFGNLLLNTSNKSEAAMGYGTLYGDTNGSFSILGDLYKTEVYQLAEYINRNGEIIPRSIIEKAPSAELRPDQKDSDSLPDYEVLDGVLKLMLEENLSVIDIVAEGYDVEMVEMIKQKFKIAEFKRHQFAPTVRLSKCALGVDRVMPVIYKA